MNDSELITKWSKTFLLEGIEKSKELACAKTMEEVFQLVKSREKDIKEKDKSLSFEEFYQALFPLVRRLYDLKNFEIPPANKIFEDFLKFYKKQYLIFEDISKYHTIDVEAEMLNFYIDICIDNKSDEPGESLEDILKEIEEE